MALTTISGTASNLQFSAETTGHVNKGSGSIHTRQVLTLRIGDKSAMVKLPSRPDIADGESVTIAGKVKNGLFHGLAIRNDKTGVVYGTGATGAFILGGMMVLLGLVTLVIVVGIVLIPIGIWAICVGMQYAQAEKLLKRG